MRSRRLANEHVAEVARRRLRLLSAELAEIRQDPIGPTPSGRDDPDGSGEPFDLDDLEDLADPADPADLGDPAGPGGLEDPQGGWTPADPPDPRTGVDLDPRDPSGPAGPPDHGSAAGGANAAPGPSGRHARRPPGATDLAAGWVHDRLPATLQGRLQLGNSHLTVVALVVAVALAVTAWWALRAGGSVTAVPRSAVRSAAAAVPSAHGSTYRPQPLVTPAVPAATPSAAASVVVDVAGKVRDPGIATLPAGSRVVDALEAAGGVRKGVRLTGVNLARTLVDGEQILVGIPHPAGVAASAAARPLDGATTTIVNINTADETTLETLPSVGPVTATAIIRWRTGNGAFTSVDELLEVSGIGDATLAEIAPFVTV